MENNKHLLDILWEKVGCTYLSDMKTGKIRPDILRIIKTINKEEYSAEMWSEALSYIFERNIILSSPRDVEAVLRLRELLY